MKQKEFKRNKVAERIAKKFGGSEVKITDEPSGKVLASYKEKEFNLSEEREKLIKKYLKERIKDLFGFVENHSMDDLIYNLLNELEKQDKEAVRLLKEVISNRGFIRDGNAMATPHQMIEKIFGEKLNDEK